MKSGEENWNRFLANKLRITAGSCEGGDLKAVTNSGLMNLDKVASILPT
jgi:hypothetical protein